jgi:site-specific recombinase XerD
MTRYRQHELTPERKAFAAIENHLVQTRLYIEPRWGQYRFDAVRTMQVEEWLHSLPLAPASKTKLKSAFSVLFSHAIRYEWLTFNPISEVRTSSKRLREKDVLSPAEFQAPLEQLSVRDRAMVQLAGSTGAGHLHARRLPAEAGCEHETRGNAGADGDENASASFSTLGDPGGCRMMMLTCSFVREFWWT